MTVSSRRRAAAAAVAGVLLALLISPASPADDLKDKKKKVDQQLSQAREDFHESSADLKATQKQLSQSEAKLAATQKTLGASQAQLKDAQAALAQTQAERAVAQAYDQQMRVELAAAEAKLDAAEEELETSAEGVKDQNLELRRLVVAYYQQGDPSLVGIATVLTTQNPDLLTGQMQGVNTMMDKEAGLFDRLRATNVMLTVKQRNVRVARDEVEVKREAAAANLQMMQALEAQATTEKDLVARLVDANAAAVAAAKEARQSAAQAKAAAAKAKAEEAARVKQLEKERDEIKRLIAAQAAKTSGTYNGPSTGNGWMTWPVVARISSPFGYRMHPILKYVRLHDGTDIAASCGTPVRAAQSGKVIAVIRSNAGYGNRVVIDHGVAYGVGVATTYNHLSGFSTKTGAKVSKGEVIGYVGTTGQSTGCHLHFMVLENGSAVNPIRWL